MDLQLTSESKRGYTVSPSSTQIIVCVIVNCQMSVNPYFQYNMLIKNFLFLWLCFLGSFGQLHFVPYDNVIHTCIILIFSFTPVHLFSGP